MARLENRKLRYAPATEYTYSEAEWKEIRDAVKHLQECESLLSETNELWYKIINAPAVQVTFVSAHNKITHARHQRSVARRLLREARRRYVRAVTHGPAMKKVTEAIGGYIRSRLDEPSFAELIMPVVPGDKDEG